jgi:hypothetical protein
MTIGGCYLFLKFVNAAEKNIEKVPTIKSIVLKNVD